LNRFGYPVLFDITHSVRKYGIPSADPNGGMRQYLPALGRAGVAAGVDGIFMEVHPDPAIAKCDAASQMKLADLEEFIKPLIEIHQIEKQCRKRMENGTLP
jgi:2-dehydro-3-deoxyphosphooctonate aldolase (KDO 8-P synthase)